MQDHACGATNQPQTYLLSNKHESGEPLLAQRSTSMFVGCGAFVLQRMILQAVSGAQHLHKSSGHSWQLSIHVMLWARMAACNHTVSELTPLCMMQRAQRHNETGKNGLTKNY